MTAPEPMTTEGPKTAMVLAAGLGTRMRPLTDARPKALVEVAGRTLIDRVLDELKAAGVERCVVNVHHFAHQMEAHLAGRRDLEVRISDERGELLDTGGGVVKALRRLGDQPFLHMNSDTLWIEGVTPNLVRLGAQFDPADMDILLLLASTTASIGYEGRGDFAMAPDGRLRRRGEREVTPFIYAGAAVLSPAQFADAPQGKFSLNRMFDRAIEAGRMHGLRLDGTWMHVGTPAAIAAAEKAIEESVV